MIIDGKKIAYDLSENLKKDIGNQLLTLHVILVGNYPPSQIYVKRKEEACKNVGIKSMVHKLPESVSTAHICELIKTLNRNDSVNAILVQLPLPSHINQEEVIETINPFKDVDGLTAYNLGRLFQGNSLIIPCTPQGCMQLINTVERDIKGKTALVIGRSTLVGKPIGQLLLSGNATVTYAHSHTVHLEQLAENSDIIVAATGVPGLIKRAKKDAIIIDVGITYRSGKIHGDVDFEALKNQVRAITPVPGGVGPMTVVNLLINTYKCFKLQNRI